MKKTLFSKIYLGYLLIIILLSALILVFVLPEIKANYIGSLKEKLTVLATSIQDEALGFIKKGDYSGLDSFVKSLGEKINTRITVIATDGRVLADSRKNPSEMENHLHRPEVQGALAGKVSSSIRYSSTVKEEMLYVALPLRDNGETVAIIRTSLFLKDIRVILSNFRSGIVRIIIGVALLAVLVSLFLSKAITRPIRELINKVNQVADGDFEARIIPSGEVEISRLAESFNIMTERINELFKDLRAKRDELESIISSMSDPLVVIDGENRVTRYNQSFKDLSSAGVIEGRGVWEVLRAPGLDEFVKRVWTGGEASAELEIGGRYFILSGGLVRQANEVLIVFHDVTEIKELENLKREFVVNVSHELRTPLTIIKGYIETLEEEATDTQREYIVVLKRHVGNLIGIVKDLLTLSELEERSAGPSFETVDFAEILKEVAGFFKRKAKEKGLYLEENLPAELPFIKGDKYKIEQMLINIVDNAIRYTDHGGVRISVGVDGDFLEIVVEDTGIGIPEEHLSRIFERFYVVDKSRSKETGGTGLGLSIVKHIVNLHNGTINVESKPASGTKFKIRLPINPQEEGERKA